MSSRPPGFLDSAYDLGSVEEMGEHYDRWASTYEQELADNGYATPRRCAEALASLVDERDAPVLDLGCGTGLSGVALAAAGFTVVDGLDFSPGMLEVARGKAGVYRHLGRVDLSVPLDVERGAYRHACAAGVVNPGHAPARAVNHVLDVLPAGGVFVLSLNDHALADPEYPGAVRAAVDGGVATLDFEQHGEHLPGIGLSSTVFALRRR